jgi:hypothetical protein
MPNTAYEMRSKIFSRLTLLLCAAALLAEKSHADTWSVDDYLSQYYDGEWEMVTTEKSHNTVYNFYQRDTVYKSPGQVVYIWSFSRDYAPDDDEDNFVHLKMGHATTDFTDFVKGLAQEFGKYGIPISKTNKAATTRLLTLWLSDEMV